MAGRSDAGSDIACLYCAGRLETTLVARRGERRWSVCSLCGSMIEWSLAPPHAVPGDHVGEPAAAESFYREVRDTLAVMSGALGHLHDEWETLDDGERRRLAGEAAERVHHAINELLPVLTEAVRFRARRDAS